MKLHNFTNEILDIAEANNVDTGVGMDMFLANICNFPDKRLPFYKGADNVDYKALKPHVKELQASKTAFSIAVRKKLQKVAKLRKGGKREEVKQMVLAYVEK